MPTPNKSLFWSLFDESSLRVRKSCAECHSHILTSLPRAGLIEVCVGSASQLSLNAHFFYVTPMIDFGDDVPKFVDFPASLGGSGVQASSWDLHRDVTQAFHGSCLCGSVFVSISGEPKTTAFCHCLVCRSWTGSSGHFAVVFDEDLVQISGELISTRHGHRNCARCLACITSRHSAAAPGFLEVCGGILHSPPRVQAHWNYGQRILCLSCKYAAEDVWLSSIPQKQRKHLHMRVRQMHIEVFRAVAAKP